MIDTMNDADLFKAGFVLGVEAVFRALRGPEGVDHMLPEKAVPMKTPIIPEWVKPMLATQPGPIRSDTTEIMPRHSKTK